jgi:hypothetical protein
MLGIVLFLFGLISLVLPVSPGILLIALGLYVLSIDSPGLRRRIDAIRARYTAIDRACAPIDRFFLKKDGAQGTPKRENDTIDT